MAAMLKLMQQCWRNFNNLSKFCGGILSIIIKDLSFIALLILDASFQ